MQAIVPTLSPQFIIHACTWGFIYAFIMVMLCFVICLFDLSVHEDAECAKVTLTFGVAVAVTSHDADTAPRPASVVAVRLGMPWDF